MVHGAVVRVSEKFALNVLIHIILILIHDSLSHFWCPSITDDVFLLKRGRNHVLKKIKVRIGAQSQPTNFALH